MTRTPVPQSVRERRATVVGAGVAGLTTATALVEAGWSVQILAAATFDQTVSSVAAAVWTMTESEPFGSARRWALASRRRFERLVADVGPASGVAPLRQRELERIDPGPLWWESTPYVRRVAVNELPAGYAAGFEIDGFIIEPPRYLAWLTARLAEAGVTVTIDAVDRLDDVEGDIVVNCTGLAARDLVGDATLFPIRGQVVAVRNPAITESVSDECDPDHIAYIYPRSSEVILGGARQVGNEDRSPDPALTERILADTEGLNPHVAGSEVLAVRVGLRPGRPQVRVGLGRLADGRPVAHNYGHGGAGYILSWGCAFEVLRLAGEARLDRDRDGIGCE